MVEWASGRSERTFDQSAANGRKEPELPIFCRAANVWFRETDKLGLGISVQTLN